MLKKVGFVALGVFVFCGVAQAQSDTHAYDNIHSIGVYSGMVPTALLAPGGPMPLDWDINADITKVISGALKDKFSIKPVLLDRDKVQKAFADGSFSGLGKFLQASPPQDVDAYLIVIPDKLPNFSQMIPAAGIFLDFTVRLYPGLALTDSSDFFHPHANTMVSATYDLIIISARTGELMGWTRVHNAHGDPHKGYMLAFCPNSFLPRTVDEAKGPKGEDVLNELKALVLTYIPDTLQMMNLPSQVDLTAIAPPSPPSCKTIL